MPKLSNLEIIRKKLIDRQNPIELITRGQIPAAKPFALKTPAPGLHRRMSTPTKSEEDMRPLAADHGAAKEVGVTIDEVGKGGMV